MLSVLSEKRVAANTAIRGEMNTITTEPMIVLRVEDNPVIVEDKPVIGDCPRREQNGYETISWLIRRLHPTMRSIPSTTKPTTASSAGT